MLLLAGCTLLVHGRIVRHDFVAWDDDGHITDNPRLDPVSWQSLVRFWREPYFGHYVPLSYTTFTAEAWLAQSHRDQFGKLHFKPAVFHAGSLLLHVGCTLLAYRLLMMILGHATAACLGALIFALHPLQVESVAWISEQRGLLAGLFTFLALMAWMKFGAGRPGEPAGAGYYLLATAAYVLALLAKPSAVCLPLLAAALDIFLLRRSWRMSIAALLPWLAGAAVMMIVTRREQPASLLSYLPPPWTRPLIAGDALQFYLAKLVWPTGLVAQYPRAPLIVLQGDLIYLAWLVPAAVFLACWRYRRHGPWMVCAGWFLAVLLPVLGLTPFAYQHFSTVADRYAYLAVFAPALAAAWWVAQNPSGWRSPAMAGLLLLLAALSFQQAGHWRDTETLFAHTMRHNPRSDVAHGNWGAELLRRGRYEEALKELDEAFRINPKSGTEKLYLNRGLALLSLGRLDESIAVYEEALSLFPKANPAHINLGAAYFQKQDWQRAAFHSRAALVMEPESTAARFNLALALQRQGKADEAEQELQKLLTFDAGHFEARMKLATLLMQRDAFDDALRHFELSLQKRPDDREARREYADALTRAGRAEQAQREHRLLNNGGSSIP
jgi:tetratricopeptide (TPR) repeat protein